MTTEEEKKCNIKVNIKGVIHQCGKEEGHYNNDDLHSCSCGYVWNIRGKYIKVAKPEVKQ